MYLDVSVAGGTWYCDCMTPSFPTPQNKFNVQAVERALNHGSPPDGETISELLEWTQDENWPVAGPVTKLLSSFGRGVAPALIEVLGGDDSTWKHALLRGLVLQLEPDTWVLVEPAVRRLAEHPTDEEVREDVNTAAQKALAQHSNLSG
ncbi:DUF5071 domain-containing protein [Leisingera sp. ANG-Vp]|uniref:DUF5071 domain-containing protein n=1 Tax=Leisingera sp. ANG-Vp TaxID=1577896 RepID=UPI00126A1C0B|nr:DUF5071 domain-containing protein [Leisingera sp. ANG-Vp]